MKAVGEIIEQMIKFYPEVAAEQIVRRTIFAVYDPMKFLIITGQDGSLNIPDEPLFVSFPEGVTFIADIVKVAPSAPGEEYHKIASGLEKLILTARNLAWGRLNSPAASRFCATT